MRSWANVVVLLAGLGCNERAPGYASDDLGASGDLARRDGPGPRPDLQGQAPVTRFGALKRWSVPSSGASGGFFAASIADGRYWITTDLNGDGRPDLVQPSDPTRGQVWDSAGNPYWKVFLNNGTSFDGPLKWPVPANGTTAGFYTTSASAGGDPRQWQLRDLNGDRRPDLILTADPTKVSAQVWDVNGSPYWKVFLNNGTGFDPASNWSVPKSGLGDGFAAVEGPGGPRSWATVDVDGDGLPDLVQSSDPTKGQQVWDVNGSPYWKVALNTGAGFAASVNWAVPPSGTEDGFSTTRVSSGARQWQLLDLDADGKPELVQTADTTKGQQVWDAAGSPYWKVFANNGRGFVLAAKNWPVPPNGTESGFFTAQVDAGTTRWATLDMNGDGLPDLVQTGDSTKSQQVWDPANPYWKVSLNSGQGFAPAQTWTLPTSGTPEGFYALGESTSQRFWATLDMDGDGRPDLVQSGDSNAGAQVWDVNGTPYWKVFPASP